MVVVFLFLQTVYFFCMVTTDGALAYEEAMRGYDIVRRHGYMLCNNRRERNFVHSLLLTFSKSHPIHITPSGYFILNRAMFLVTIAAMAQVKISLCFLNEWSDRKLMKVDFLCSIL